MNLRNSVISKIDSNKIIVFLFLLEIIYFFFANNLYEFVALTAIDDGLYYNKIAQNFWNLGKITFDGITVTNGFHPLWQIFLIVLYFFNTNTLQALVNSYLLIFVFNFFSLLLYMKISKELKIKFLGILFGAMLLFFNLRSFTLFNSLMESHLILFFYLVDIVILLKLRDKKYFTVSKMFGFGVIIGLTFLARNDSFFLPVVIFSTYLFKIIKNSKSEFNRDSILSLISFTLGVSLIVIPYLIYNLIQFGSIFTVSSFNKLSGLSLSNILGSINTFYQLTFSRIAYVFGLGGDNQILVLLILLFTITIIIGLILKYKLFKVIYNRILLLNEFVIFTLLHFLFILFFVPYEALFSIWFLVPEIISFTFLFSILIDQIKLKNLRLAFFSILLIFYLLQFPYSHYFINKKKMTFAKIELANYIKNNIINDTRIAMYDAGIVSYFSEGKIFAINGLISDFKFAKYAKQFDYSHLASEYKINYLIWDVPDTKTSVLPGKIIFKTKIKSLYADFSEGEKSFYLYKLLPKEFNEFYHLRYK